jgi:hypothetical protein
MIFPLTSVSRPALGPTQPPVQWVPEVLSLGVKHGRAVTLTTHPYLVPRSGMSRSHTPSSPPPSASMACRTALLHYLGSDKIFLYNVSIYRRGRKCRLFELPHCLKLWRVTQLVLADSTTAVIFTLKVVV